MGKLFEICDNKNYEHKPLTEFGKKYYYLTDNSTIICEDCLLKWIDTSSEKLATELEYIVKNCNQSQINASQTINRNIVSALHTEVTVSELSNTTCKSLLSNRFTLNVGLYASEIPEQDEDTGEVYLSIASADITVLDDFLYNGITFTIPLYTTDNAVTLKKYIYDELMILQKYITREIPPEKVQLLMDEKASPNYSSSCCCDDCRCDNCFNKLSPIYYFYKNNKYCLNCMYGIVTKLVIGQTLSDIIGLSNAKPPCDSSVYNIYDSDGWKRSVIDKYINYMKSIGLDPEIITVCQTYSI